MGTNWFRNGTLGRRKHILKPGERKSIATDRVTLRLGPRKAVATIKLAFDLFTRRGKNYPEIADNPLPASARGGKILVSRKAFDEWMKEQAIKVSAFDVERIVNEILEGL